MWTVWFVEWLLRDDRRAPISGTGRGRDVSRGSGSGAGGRQVAEVNRPHPVPPQHWPPSASLFVTPGQPLHTGISRSLTRWIISTSIPPTPTLTRHDLHFVLKEHGGLAPTINSWLLLFGKQLHNEISCNLVSDLSLVYYVQLMLSRAFQVTSD